MGMIKNYIKAQAMVSKAVSELAHAERDWNHTKNTSRARLFWVRLVKARRQLVRAKRAELLAFEQMIIEKNKAKV